MQRDHQSDNDTRTAAAYLGAHDARSDLFATHVVFTLNAIEDGVRKAVTDWLNLHGLSMMKAAVQAQARAEAAEPVACGLIRHVAKPAPTPAEAVERVACGLIRHLAKPSPGCRPDGCRRRCVSLSVRSTDRALFAAAFALAVEDGRIMKYQDGTLRGGRMTPGSEYRNCRTLGTCRP